MVLPVAWVPHSNSTAGASCFLAGISPLAVASYKRPTQKSRGEVLRYDLTALSRKYPPLLSFTIEKPAQQARNANSHPWRPWGHLHSLPNYLSTGTCRSQQWIVSLGHASAAISIRTHVALPQQKWGDSQKSQQRNSLWISVLGPFLTALPVIGLRRTPGEAKTRLRFQICVKEANPATGQLCFQA